ncbi:2'-5' RNA ligase family protein [Arthrobacter koreensis]|uniref:2'-5' RNA ligase family protein n=1 Tax=Arthrobacter koreensis TaxID=199136 RepID=UPI002DBFB407|nr:2'-5' RNA ligase family protein [Arthrobacter koreensis]MEB7505133.1 2'-5' RNA ligase family protein [Arthrobacter koreensis]
MAAIPSDPSRDALETVGALAGVRIYAQLKPDAAGLAELQRLQSEARVLVPRARTVSSGRLHLTLIHFGKADEAYERLERAAGVVLETFSRALERYLAATEASLPVRDFLLTPIGLAGFGINGSTLALECSASPELQEVHAVLYALVLEFLAACGVSDPAGYAAQDPALAFSAVLRPHISILHGFRLPAEAAGRLPVPALEQLRLHPLPVLYRA